MEGATELDIARLRSQVSRAEPILFYGVGLSSLARGSSGLPLPNTRDLAETFWKVAFPSEPFDQSARLQDAFRAAQVRNPKALLATVQQLLTVDSSSLPDLYRGWFSIPWYRCYTLNVDDLELAVARRFELRRDIRSVSATSDRRVGTGTEEALEVVHLNGLLGDPLEALTFSDVDYARRQTTPDEWFTRCAADLLVHPVVFVGTSLQEPTLWQYMEYRRTKGRGMRELRPGSYLVTPSLDAARRLVLEDLNIDWVRMDAHEFVESVISKLADAAEEGKRALRARFDVELRRRHPALVGDLTAAEKPIRESDYLMGREPSWSDLQAERAITRECDTAVYETARALMRAEPLSQPMVLTGTAGSGKSTSLMRLGLRLTAEGVPVYWIDERTNIEPYRLREVITRTPEPVAILVDDADIWGPIVSGWARELPQIRRGVLFAAAVRSGRVDGLLDAATLVGTSPVELSMPHLDDSDIEALIGVLDAHNRLGVLKGKSHLERVRAFRDQAGRQLLVAMIQATSGQNFREKVLDEFTELPDLQKQIYATICLVSSQRVSLDRDEVLLALGGGNDVLNELEKLIARHLVIRDQVHANYAARHRVIAEELVNGARASVGHLLEGICYAFATKVDFGMPRHSRPWRRLIRFTNHEFLMRFTPNVADARNVYQRLEDLLHWDWNYWLQRGALEVEVGDLALATNFLDQARSLAEGEKKVETEYAYLLMKKAAADPQNSSAPAWFEEGRRTLEAFIASDGRHDPYPYHVLGSQGLGWVRRAPLPRLERQALLRELLQAVQSGVDFHPRKQELATLLRDIKHEWLSTAVTRD